MNSIRSFLLPSVFVSLCFVARGVDAPITTAELRLGAYVLSEIDVRFNVSSENGPGGTPVDFGDDLAGEQSLTVFRADGSWHFVGAHGIDATWYRVNLSGRRTIDRNINFGGDAFPAGVEVESTVETDIYKLAYGYTFRRGTAHELTALLGVHVMDVQVGMKAASLSRDRDFNATAPLPVIGFGWKGRWTDRLTTRVVVQYFGISVDDDKYSGHFIDALATVQYRLIGSFGLGIGYNRFDLNAEIKNNGRRLEFENTHNGLLAFLFAEF
jgi:hypothetical protein